jgi:hypothetical protein
VRAQGPGRRGDPLVRDIQGQAMIAICRVPPRSEGTVNVFSALSHGGSDNGGDTTVAGGGELASPEGEAVSSIALSG